MEIINAFLIIIGSLIAFILFWIFVVWLIAQMAGWPKLVEKYPDQVHKPEKGLFKLK